MRRPPPIPGFPAAAIAIGIIASMGTIVVLRRKRR